MKKQINTWEAPLKELVAELIDSERTYGTLIQSDRQPEWQVYFSKRHFQGKDFAKVLSDEYFTVSQRKLTAPIATENPIFASLEKQMLEHSPSDRETTVLILDKEEQLAGKYRDLLAYSDLPDATAAILQSQAEDLNTVVQNLRMDYQTKYNSGPVKTN